MVTFDSVGPRPIPTTRIALAVFAAILLAIAARAYLGQRTELRVGYNSYIPFVMPSPGAAPTGLAVEVLTEAARRAGVRLSWIPIGDPVDEALRDGTVDIFPVLTLTPSRVSEFHTSEAWWENETALISLEKNPVQTAAGTAGKKIAIRGLPILKKLAESLFPRSTLVTIPQIEAMVDALCKGGVDGAFLDVRLLQSQLLKGPRACVNTPLHVISVAGGSLSQGTIARKEVSAAADRIYERIAEVALDGTLSEIASRWSLVSSFQNRHMKDSLDARHRARAMRYGLLLLTAALILTWAQNRRVLRARKIAEESRKRFDAFMKHTPAVTFIRDETGRVVYVNEALSRRFRLSTEEVANQLAKDERAIEGNRSVESTETITLASGEQRWFLCLRFPFAHSDGSRFTGTVALDITERRRAEEALQFSQFSIDRSPDSILWVDSRGRIFYANEAACKNLGYTHEELCSLKIPEVYAHRDPRELEERLENLHTLGSFSAESALRARNGSLVPVELALYPLEFGGANFTCCISRDITDRKRAERELAYQAQHDGLTGLPNRRCFEGRLEESIELSQRNGSGLAIFYFDLDRFKLINDTLGHGVGDSLLKMLVRRIETCVRSGDTLARMGGDEFTLLAPGIDDPDSARFLADKLVSCLSESFFVDGHELLVTASLGISMFPADGRDGITLLQNADAAMYEAKRQGKNRQQFFNPSINVTVRERLEIENHLRRALGRGELSLHYQPQIAVGSGEVLRYEALLRWNNPVLGTVPPVKFIAIAEETGLIVPIGAWVLEEACRHAKRLFDAGSNTGVGVNVSSVQFSRPDFVGTVSAALERTALPPCLLEIELTESVVMQGIEDVAKKIALLRQAGVSISIDDFGTGYSSLSYLQNLRVDYLKIDRSFISDIPSDAAARSLTNALVSLAHGLGMKVVAEGVENKQQLDAVREMGCDLAQGYFIGRPRPAQPVSEVQPELHHLTA